MRMKTSLIILFRFENRIESRNSKRNIMFAFKRFFQDIIVLVFIPLQSDSAVKHGIFNIGLPQLVYPLDFLCRKKQTQKRDHRAQKNDNMLFLYPFYDFITSLLK